MRTDHAHTTEERTSQDGAPVRRNALLGAAAGAIGLGCCLYPVVLVLLGLSSASAAVGLGNRLFTQWGWAFKLSGLAFACIALWVQRRRARSCFADSRPRLVRAAVTMLGVAVLTYAALYLGTTWLGRAAS